MRGRTGAAPLRRQLVLVASGVTAAAMLLLVLIVQLVLNRVVTGNIDTVLRDRAYAARATLQDADPSASSTDVDEIGPGVVVFDADGRRLTGAVPEGAATELDRLATVTSPQTVEVGEQVRLLAVPFATPHRRGVVVAVESVTPYERAEAYALAASVVLGLVAVGAVAGLTAWTVRRSLAPVAAMASTADDWSVHDLGRRFELGPPTTEITALGATLDRLLERVGGALRAEQRLTAEVAHELRTPLTALIGSVDVALLRGDLDQHSRAAFEEVGDAARRMATTVTTLVDLARAGEAAFGEGSTVGEILEALDAQGLEIATGPPDGAVEVAMPVALAVRALEPVLDNARRHCHSRVRVTCRVDARHVDVLVDDDGDGLSADDSADIFDPGVRSAASGGAGLGLPLARRIARSAGGDVYGEATDGGARFVVRLPRR